MMRGVSASAAGSDRIASLKCSLVTCGPAPSSANASTSTNSLGSSVLRDHSNHRFPGSARVASVKSLTSSSQRSDQSGFVVNFTTIRITASPAYCSRVRRGRAPGGGVASCDGWASA